LFAVSVDGVWCHQAFCQQRRLSFGLLSDFHPRGEVARLYGVYDDARGVAGRAIFVVGRSCRVVWRECYASALSPGVSGILDALR
jgi:peroxiredoxin